MSKAATLFRLIWTGLFGFAGLLTAGPAAFAQAGKNPQSLAKAIDAEILKALAAQKVPPSPRTDDAEFLRRVYLDIAGVIPTAEQAAGFLDNHGPDKRARLIDALLGSPEHARQMADLWKELLLPKTAAAMRRDQLPLFHWLNQSFAANKPWDNLFHELLTASGMQDESPATTFYIVHESVDMVADRVSRVLLGVQLQCAQCHDHPFADWKRDEYWAFAGFFGKVGSLYQRSPQGGERYGAGEMSTRKLMQPDSARQVPLKFLRGAAPQVDPARPYLPVLADWLTGADNPYFARALVNRVWFHFFGRGLVNPVDGMNADNRPTHPELLDRLAREFVASGFDGRFLMRTICLSETYQRSSRPVDGNQDDTKLYSHMPLRVLLPFQLHDSWEQVLSVGDAKPSAAPTATDPKLEKRIHGSRNGFAAFFTPEEGSVPTDYRAGIPQALRLMNGKDSYRINRVVPVALKQTKSAPETITHLYLMALARRPRPEELERITRLVAEENNPTQTYTDILWALLNSTEFITNH